jgi:membrane-associated phospholipid phosphatase
MLYLQTANQDYPLMVLDVQKTLLDWQQSGGSQLGRGISAMPSMHVSLAFLFFLMMRHVSPLAGRLFGVYFVIILIGSVHLGYHYAVDGYVSIIITGLIWKATGYFAKGVSERNM